jgi:hypothetical protein
LYSSITSRILKWARAVGCFALIGVGTACNGTTTTGWTVADGGLGDSAQDGHTGSSGTSASGSSGSTSGGSGDAGDTVAAARVQCVQMINMYRATLNPPSPPLTENTPSESCVDQQAQADFTTNNAHSAFGMCSESAQDECPGWSGPPSSVMTKCLAAMWAEGPPPAGQDNHWLNMSNAQYTQIACGFYQTPSGDWWATQDFW